MPPAICYHRIRIEKYRQNKLEPDRNAAFCTEAKAALLNHGALPQLVYCVAVRRVRPHGEAELIYLVGLCCLLSVTLNGVNVSVPESEAM